MVERHLERSLTAEQVCDQLGGLMSPHTLLRRARKGLVPGAFKIGHRVWFAKNTALWMIVELSATSAAGYAITLPREAPPVNGTHGYKGEYVQPR